MNRTTDQVPNPLTGHPHEVRLAVLAIATGVAGAVPRGADDSPGLQLLGVLLIIGAVVLGVRMVQRRR
jgi:hypothetical protein